MRVYVMCISYLAISLGSILDMLDSGDLSIGQHHHFLRLSHRPTHDLPTDTRTKHSLESLRIRRGGQDTQLWSGSLCSSDWKLDCESNEHT